MSDRIHRLFGQLVPTIPIRTPVPDFDLPGVDGKRYSTSSFTGPVLVVAFWCNHCPYVRDFEGRFLRIASDYASRGVQVVAINSNDEKSYPEDDFAHMVSRSKEKGYTFPYLRDEPQKAAEAFGAVCTPHLFAFDKQRTLRYRGRIDDSRDPAKTTTHDLRNALDDLLAGSDVRVPDTRPFGCSIKWFSMTPARVS